MPRLGRGIPIGVTYQATYIQRSATAWQGFGEADGIATVNANATVISPNFWFGAGESDGLATVAVTGTGAPLLAIGGGEADGFATVTASAASGITTTGQANGFCAVTALSIDYFVGPNSRRVSFAAIVSSMGM